MIMEACRGINRNKYRVPILPVGVYELGRRGNQVLIAAGAVAGSGLVDQEYQDNGAEIVGGQPTSLTKADWVLKVKESQPSI